MASLRSQGFVPKMVKTNTGNTVYAHSAQDVLDIYQSFAKLLGLLRACNSYEFEHLPQFWRDAFPESESQGVRYAEEIRALDIVYGHATSIEVPEIRQAGFNPPIKRDFWGNIVE